MCEQENTVLKIHRVDSDGSVIFSARLQITETPDPIIPPENILIPSEFDCDKSNFNWCYFSDDKLNLNYYRFAEEKIPSITLIKCANDMTAVNYATNVNYTKNLDSENYVFSATDKRQVKHLNLPDTSVISCQNCDTTFPTKYQYQRHQCEFNADKVVLKPEVSGKDLDKAVRLRFECDVCKKSFVSNNNLERHKNCHKNTSENVCEHCNKVFVSENRLKIHKENHCKKAGDTTKFYRSDVVVWRCNCQQVFATQESGNKHALSCPQSVPEAVQIVKTEPESSLFELKSVSDICDSASLDKSNLAGNRVTKIITEMLYQCEFCNRTYAEKASVLTHQKTHTTEKNYECIFCQQHFDSFTLGTAHWQSKCNDESNLFYLPKMIYCEHCDRGFKSHEILYNHKNKKKHFTPKIRGSQPLKGENEKAIVKLIENMINKMGSHDTFSANQSEYDPLLANDSEIGVHSGSDVTNVADHFVNSGNNNSLQSAGENSDNQKNNHLKSNSDKDDNNLSESVVNIQEPGKKKRGRKRKWQKAEAKNKKSAMEDGCMYQCERCAAVFEEMATLDVHKETSHASTFNCEQCGQVVHSAKALMIHCRAHQCLKPYVCDQCGRSYSQTSHLWQHMRFHQGIKPFACPHEGCEARYTIRPDLKDHIRKVHTRERPFRCSVCQKCFLTGSVYYQHRLIHTNDRRYGCEICNKRFFRADALNNHRRIHTDERPYPCPVCGREFRQKGDRNKHVRTQHTM